MESPNRAAKKYCRQVRLWLPGGQIRRPIMKQLRCAVDDYIFQNPRANLSALQLHFGSPRDVAAAFVENMDTKELLRSLRIRQRVLAAAVSVALLFSIAWAVHNVLMLHKVYGDHYGAYAVIYYE